MPTTPRWHRVATDYALILGAREGDSAAFTALLDRDRVVAAALARHYVGSADAEALLSEVASRVWQHLLLGEGPTEAFRPYLLVTIRRVNNDRGSAALGDFSPYDHGVPPDEPAAAFSRDLVRRAFAGLSDRSKVLLWHSEIEAALPEEIGQRYGLPAREVPALTMRAREGLREAYLAEHLRLVVDPEPSPGDGSACRLLRPKLSPYLRGTLSDQDREQLSEHLVTCAGCAGAHKELRTINDQLPTVLALSLLGLTAEAYRGLVLAEAAATDALVIPAAGLADTAGEVPSILDEPPPKQASAWPRRALAMTAVAAVLVALAFGAVALIWPDGQEQAFVTSPDRSGYPTATLSPSQSASASGSPSASASGTPSPTPTTPSPTPSATPTATATSKPKSTSGGAGWTLAVDASSVGAWMAGGSAKLRVTTSVGGSGSPLPDATMVISGAAGFGVESGDGWSCSGGGSQITCSRGSLPAGSSRDMISLRAPNSRGSVTLTVRVSGQGVSDQDSLTVRIR